MYFCCDILDILLFIVISYNITHQVHGDQVNLQAPFLVDEKCTFLVLKKCRGIYTGIYTCNKCLEVLGLL